MSVVAEAQRLALYPAAKGRSQPSRLGWSLTFADLMMLLLTFFILIISFSRIDETKYRQLADGMRQQEPIPTAPSAQGSGTPSHVLRSPPAVVKLPVVTPPAPAVVTPTPLQQEIDDELIEVERNNGHLIIRFQDAVAFQSASDRLDEGFRPVLDKIGHMLADLPGKITVAGHTDDRPIATPRFRSNWDLSTARAVSVIHALLRNEHIAASRLTAVGYADTEPLVPNDNEADRAMNRRVEIRVAMPEDSSVALPAPLQIMAPDGGDSIPSQQSATNKQRDGD